MWKHYLLLTMVVLILGCTEATLQNFGNESRFIGGQHDERGCLGPAGYSWNGTVGACIREWELSSLQKVAAQKAVNYVGRTFKLTVVQIDEAECIGCFIVHLNVETNTSIILLDGWEVSLTKDICSVDEDCVPLPVCHPTMCINKNSMFTVVEPQACTEIFMLEAAYTPEDCMCQENRCVNKNLERV